MKHEPKSLVRSSWRMIAFWRPARKARKGVTLVTEWRR